MLAHLIMVYTGVLDAVAAPDGGVRWWAWEPKTLRARLIAVVSTHSRQRTLRLDPAAAHQGLLQSIRKPLMRLNPADAANTAA